MKTYEERTARIEEKAKTISKHKKRNIILSITSCSLAVVLALSLTLFVPYSVGGFNISAYEDSEYYEVIKQLAPLTYSEAQTTNNFTEWFGDISFSGYGTSAAPSDGGEVAGVQTYQEVTNNQTEGVIEGDLFKRSDEYVYYLNYTAENYEIMQDADGNKSKVLIPASLVIEVYNIGGEQTELVSEYTISYENGTSYSGYIYAAELFLSADCQTLTIIAPCYDTSAKLLYTSIITLDVSDVQSIEETNRVYVSGDYVSSRMTDESLLLVCNFSVKGNTDFSDEAQFLPQTGALDDLTTLPLENIVLPDSATTAAYTIICLLDPDTLAVTDCEALLSYSDEVYVSSQNAYVTRSYTVTREETFESVSGYAIVDYLYTEIVRINYTDGLTVENTASVMGTVNDRYSLDEYGGVLRVFTTTSYGTIEITYTTTDDNVSSDSVPTYLTTANLYCLDIDDMSVIAGVEGFCPEGEKVMSARFDGETAYACTAAVYVEITEDPVYQFNLSDYGNITYTDTGTIPGYSLSLVTFTDGTLLGIGYGDWLDSIKISLYREEGSEVVSVAEYTKENASFSTDFKSYFIDAENGLIGLGLCYYDDSDGYFIGYLLLRYDGYNLVTVAEIELNDSDYGRMRADYIDGYLYLFAANGSQTVYIG